MRRTRATASIAAILLATIASGAQTPRRAPERFFEWSALRFPIEEYAARRSRLLASLAESGGGLLLVPSAEGLSSGDTFRQLDDFLYLTGLELPRSVLVLDADQTATILFVPERDARFENPSRPNDFPGRRLGTDPELPGRCGIAEIRPYRELARLVAEAERRGRLLRVRPRRAGSLVQPESDFVAAWDPVDHLVAHVRSRYPKARLASAFAAVARLRSIKSPREVEVITRAVGITVAAIREAAAQVRPDVDERTLEGILEAAFKRGGAQRPAFSSIIKSGPNSLHPWRVLAAHYDRRNRIMGDGDLVIFDVGCELDHYTTDVGRTFPVNGRFSERQRELVDLVRRTSDAILAEVRPGATLLELQKTALRAVPEEERRHMQAGLFFGHHFGLEVGDPTVSEEPLEAGMTFTVEPWYYNHDEGIAVFIEDDVLVTEDGVLNLTADLPRTPAELEAMVAPRPPR